MIVNVEIPKNNNTPDDMLSMSCLTVINIIIYNIIKIKKGYGRGVYCEALKS